MPRSMWDWAACCSPTCSQTGSTRIQIFQRRRRQSMNPKITEHHRSKPAYIYLRQSTPGQVRHHQESTERQYALREKALELGWNDPAIRILDRDLGMSGAQATRREDFKTLVADVSMGQVGAVFALEISRLARSNLDWHRLLELCALTATLVIDEDGCYDPSDFNGRTHLQGERNRVLNRIRRLLETVNIKLGSVVSDINGKTARLILEQIAQGNCDPKALSK